MSDFQDVGQFHKNETTGKWRFQKLGYAKPNKNGDGLDVYLDALPIPTNGSVRLAIQPQRERQQDSGSGNYSAPTGGGLADDEIPF